MKAAIKTGTKRNSDSVLNSRTIAIEENKTD